MRDAEGSIAFGGQKTDDRLAVTRLRAPHDGGELGRPAQRVQPRIPGEGRQAEEPVLDDVLENSERLVTLAQMRKMARSVKASFGIVNARQLRMLAALSDTSLRIR